MTRRGRARAVLATIAAILTGRLIRYEIADHSMEPTLRPGDWVAALRRPRRVHPGDVVVFAHPSRPGFDLVKRVDHADQRRVEVRSDAVGHGVDSKDFGPIEPGAIAAKVLLVYAPRPFRPV